jgi:hypothetical protein
MGGDKMINVEVEVSKHKNCKDRDELGMLIREYKNLALQSARDMALAGKYNSVALKLQEIYDKLPAPHLKNPGNSNLLGVPTKTANISSEENAKINAAWQKKTGGHGST